MTALELGQAIKKGQITAVQAVEATLEEIKEQDKDINAVITACGDEAISQAAIVQEKIEKGELDSPLAGVPILIKDNIFGGKTDGLGILLRYWKGTYDVI